MSNIRPIGDPAVALAMLTTMQSIDVARSAPSGISEPRWRILQCIAKAAPNVPTPGELRLCSALNKAALAEHLQALRWKGLIEMGGYRLSPSAAAMVGLELPYPPKDAKGMTFADISGRSGTVIIDEYSSIGASPELPLADIGPLSPELTIIGVDMASLPDITVEARVTFGADGKIAKIEPILPMDPADVPACMRPDCIRPELDHAISSIDIPGDRPDPAKPQVKSRTEREKGRRWGDIPEKTKTNKHGRGGAAVAHPTQGDVHHDRVATDRAPRTPVEVAGSNPAPGQPTKPTISAPPATPPKFTNWIEQRAARINAAIAFLGSLGIPVSIADRSADIRTYFVSANRRSLFAEEVIEFAIEKGWVE